MRSIVGLALLVLLTSWWSPASAMGAMQPASTSLDTAAYGYDTPAYTDDARALLLSPDTVASYVRGAPSEPEAVAREVSASTRGCCTAANGGARLGGRIVTEDALGDVAIRNAMRVKPEAGVFDVIGHGTPSSVSGMSASELAGAIRARPGWGGQDIRLLSCSTGCPTGNFAQGLANELGVVVRAPSTDIFVSSRGGITFDNGGAWRVSSPGG